MNWKGCERKLLLPNLKCTVLTYFPEGLWLSFGPGTYRIQSMIDVPDFCLLFMQSTLVFLPDVAYGLEFLTSLSVMIIFFNKSATAETCCLHSQSSDL
jgi:hypothetical protein